MSENIINTTNVNDTINTQQTEKQETVLVDNVVAENNGEQQPKAKKHTKSSEFEKMASVLGILNWIGIATNMPILTTSIVGLINKEDDSFYKFALGSSLIGFCKNISCLTYIGIKLSKLKKKNKELKTETVLENDEEKQNEVIPEEKKQEDKQIKTTTANQELKNKSEELKTETVLENDEEKQVEVIPEEKKQDEKQIKTATNQELKNKSEELEKLNNKLGKNIIPEEKKQDEKQIKTATNQELKNKSEELEKLNNKFSSAIANGIISPYKGTGTIL